MQDFSMPSRIKKLKTLFRTCFLMKNLCSMVCGVLVWTCGPELELELELMYLNKLKLVVLFFLCRVLSSQGVRFYLQRFLMRHHIKQLKLIYVLCKFVSVYVSMFDIWTSMCLSMSICMFECVCVNESI
jgi:hypothetical protein